MTHKTKTRLAVVCLGSAVIAVPAGAQSVVAAAGGTAKSGTTILEWTLGEPVVETGARPKAIYTQGFHQPLLRVQKWAGRTAPQHFQMSMQVYPNPTAAVVYVKLQAAAEAPLLLTLSDVNGEQLQTARLPAGSTLQSLNLAGYAKGVYLLRVAAANGALHEEYKILKAH